jgi:hypothetical protein
MGIFLYGRMVTFGCQVAQGTSSKRVYTLPSGALIFTFPPS